MLQVHPPALPFQPSPLLALLPLTPKTPYVTPVHPTSSPYPTALVSLGLEALPTEPIADGES